MPPLVTGLHHVTAFAKDPFANRAFYTGVLGRRLVKKTVNYDDPFVHHLYYADDRGTPGTLLTHFPHPDARRGVHGVGEIVETVLRCEALDGWASRLEGAGVACAHEGGRLRFEDPDGLRLALETGETGGAADEGGREGAIAGVVVRVERPDELGGFLTGVLGFEERGGRFFAEDAYVEVIGGGGVGEKVGARAVFGAGIVHHVAWRVPDEEAQARAAEAMRAARVGVTEVKDRTYFKSVYARTPGGVIFEVATDGPGFGVDERPEALGEGLMLPARLEPRRGEIEARLPAL